MRNGRLTKLGRGGEAVAKILAFTSVQGLLSGRMKDDMEKKGLPFNTLNAAMTFNKGNMNINRLRLLSDAVSLNGRGTVNLVTRRLNMDAHVKPLQTLSGGLGLVPILGKAAERLTEMHLKIEGSLDNPKISTTATRVLSGGVKNSGKATEGVIKDLGKGIKDLGKGLKGLFGR